MKNSCITIGFILSSIFPVSVYATDTLSVETSSSVLIESTASLESKLENSIDRYSGNDEIKPAAPRGRNSRNNGKGTAKQQNDNSSPESSDYNPLLNYIQNYDINASRIYPRPARDISPYEDLDYPSMNPLFMPLVFNAVPRKLTIDRNEVKEPEYHLNTVLVDSLRMEYLAENYIAKLTQEIRLSAESRLIGKTKYDQKNLPKPEDMIYRLNSHKPAAWLKQEGPFPGDKTNTKALPKTAYNPWTKNGNAKLQFSQTYNSPNWSKGGESNMAGLATLFFEANYTDLKKVQFDNYIEAKIGLNTVASDSLRSLNVSTDQLRAVTKLGVKMHNDFYYSLSGEFTTQFLNNYKANTMTLQSAFMSPAKLFVGLGVDYKKSGKKKRYNLSVLLTPLTCKMSYLYDNKNLSTSSYGIDDGQHLNSELGSKLTASITWKISEQAQWKSNYYYYTDFTYVDSDWENTLDLNINHYFTTSVYVHLKLDDRLKRDPGTPLIQMQELFSFGMSYRW